MASKTPTEIELLKGFTTKLNDDTALTLAYLVHTEKGNRFNSDYIYSFRVDKIADLEAEADEMDKNENKVNKWTWKGLPKYDAVVYDKSDLNSRGAKWLRMKIKKAVSFEEAVKMIDGWQAYKKAFNKNSTYKPGPYRCEDIFVEDLRKADPVVLASYVGKVFFSAALLKCQQPKEEVTEKKETKVEPTKVEPTKVEPTKVEPIKEDTGFAIVADPLED